MRDHVERRLSGVPFVAERLNPTREPDPVNTGVGIERSLSKRFTTSRYLASLNNPFNHQLADLNE